MEKEKLTILFLCTGNSCRSQMAEGWANKFKSDSIVAFSAGVAPASALSIRAVKVMAEAGVDISKQHPKNPGELIGIDFDYIITLCDNARQQCPVFGGKGKLLHKSFPDPMYVTGSEETIMNAFRKTRDDIRDFVMTMPDSLNK